MKKKTKTIREAALAALDIIARFAEGAAMDAGFDAGEFSGPANARAEEEAITELANANGYSYNEVMDEVTRVDYENAYNYEAER